MKTKYFIIFIIVFVISNIAKSQLKVTTAGNVGIGILSPSSILHIAGGSPQFTIENSSSSNKQWSLKSSGSDFSIDETGIGSRIYFKNGGNIGIGENNPATLFSVGSGSLFRISSSGIVQSVLGSATTPTYSFTSTTNTGIFSSAAGIINFSTSGSEKMRINSSGDIGIGTTSINGKVTISQTTTTSGLRVIKSTSGYNIISQVSDTICKAIVVQNSGDKFCVWGNGRTEVGGVYGGGPYMLSVYGQTYCSSGVWTASDSHFKQNITNIDSSLVKLNQISGKKYEYKITDNPKMNFPTGYTYGVIAQEIQAIFPELVKADSAGILAVNYNGLIPVLIEAVKSQQIILKLQENKINLIESDLANCCSKPKNNQKSLNNDDLNNDSQGSLQGSETMHDIKKQSSKDEPKLYQNTPNPFNSRTEIKYYLPANLTNAAILIFDMQGTLIKTYSLMKQGNGSLEIFGNELKAGMYLYSLVADDKEIDTKKMILTE